MKLVSTITLSHKPEEVRPTMKANIYHQGKLLEITRILLDTGADKTHLSYDFCEKYNLVSEVSGTAKSIYGKDLPRITIADISIELIDDSGNKHTLDYDFIYSIVKCNYDYAAIIGMDGLSVFSDFCINFKDDSVKLEIPKKTEKS